MSPTCAPRLEAGFCADSHPTSGAGEAPSHPAWGAASGIGTVPIHADPVDIGARAGSIGAAGSAWAGTADAAGNADSVSSADAAGAGGSVEAVGYSGGAWAVCGFRGGQSG